MRLLTNCAVLGLCACTQIFAFQTSPTPEPGTIIMMGVGLAAVGAVAWRKNRKK